MWKFCLLPVGRSLLCTVLAGPQYGTGTIRQPGNRQRISDDVCAEDDNW